MRAVIFRILFILTIVFQAGAAWSNWLDYREEHAIVPYDEVKGWRVYAIDHSMSGFLGCGAVKAEPAGPLVVENYQDKWQLVVPTGRSDADRYDGALISFDDRAIDSQFGFEGGHAVSHLTRDEIGFLMQASSLKVAVNDEKPLRFNLSGSTAAVLKIRECLERRGAPPSAGAMPLAAADATTYVPSVEACLGGIRTDATGATRKIRFTADRSLDFPFDLYWIDFDGKRQPYARLAPGQSIEMESYVGHQWVAELDKDACAYAEITPGLKTVIFRYEDF
ncbi:VHL beta domain-containing protein [Martelella sp. FOR1707]